MPGHSVEVIGRGIYIVAYSSNYRGPLSVLSIRFNKHFLKIHVRHESSPTLRVVQLDTLGSTLERSAGSDKGRGRTSRCPGNLTKPCG